MGFECEFHHFIQHFWEGQSVRLPQIEGKLTGDGLDLVDPSLSRHDVVEEIDAGHDAAAERLEGLHRQFLHLFGHAVRQLGGTAALERRHALRLSAADIFIFIG